jgi:hypothetical protein
VTMQPRYFGCAFDDRETRIMGDAFIMACHVVQASHVGNDRREFNDALRSDIAATVLQIAALGVMDSGTMAQAAIDRIWGASSASA